MRALVLVTAGLVVGCATARDAPERTLCEPTEAVVFSCSVGQKMVSLCSPAAAPRSLAYRFGAPGMIELAYPDRGAVGSFEWASAPRYGGAITSVNFNSGGYEYSVYASLGRASGGANTGDPEFEDGVSVSRGGRRIKSLVCDDGGAGFRQSIEWLPRRPGN